MAITSKAETTSQALEKKGNQSLAAIERDAPAHTPVRGLNRQVRIVDEAAAAPESFVTESRIDLVSRRAFEIWMEAGCPEVTHWITGPRQRENSTRPAGEAPRGAPAPPFLSDPFQPVSPRT